MKKILLVAVLAALTMASAHALGMKHVNPMPNLVRYAMGNAELLGLNQKQLNEISNWSKAKRPKMMQLVQLVRSEEKMLLEEALGDDIDVVKKSQKMLDARKQIIEMKTACRANLKKILTSKQYAQLVNLYRTTLPMQMGAGTMAPAMGQGMGRGMRNGMGPGMGQGMRRAQ